MCQAIALCFISFVKFINEKRKRIFSILICILCTICISDLNMKAKFKNKPGFKLKYFKSTNIIFDSLKSDSVCLDDLETELLTLLFQLSFASSIPLLMLLFAILMALYPTLAQITATTVWRHQGRPLLIYPHPHQLNVWWMLSVKCVLSRAKARRVVFLFFVFFSFLLVSCMNVFGLFRSLMSLSCSYLVCYYLDTEFFVIVYRRMSVNMLVFTWISSFSSLKCPDIIHGLMQFVSNEICIETFGYLVSRVWIVCSQDVQCNVLSVLYVWHRQCCL